MSITVKELIKQLQKIENKYLPVKVVTHDCKMEDAIAVATTNYKFILIRTKK